jgi:hypothetical protein
MTSHDPTLHDPDIPRKPSEPVRVRRFWLYAPYVALLVVMIGWSLYWVWARATLGARMDAEAARLRETGFTMDWKSRSIGGYPFRIDVTLDGLRLGEPSGWALTAPEIKAETYAYRLDQWIGYAPQGVTLTRPVSGAVTITGPALRASYASTGQGVPRIAVEGLKLVFTPQTGARPFLIGAAEHLDFHLRPYGEDRAEFLLRVDGASAPAGAILAQIAENRPMDIAWEGRLSHVSALHGRDWPTAAQTWTGVGGGLEVEHGLLSAGPVSLNLRPGRLTIGNDGRLRGGVGLDLRPAAAIIRSLAASRMIEPSAADSALAVIQAQAAGGPTTQTDLTFLAGQTLFGPVAVGPSPKVY